MQMSFMSAVGWGGRELWNCFSKQMSKRKISCLTTSHPSSAGDRDGGGVLSVCRARGQSWVPVSWV